jgi:hypothetical protein
MSISSIFTNGVLIDLTVCAWTGEKQLTAEDLGLDKKSIPKSFKLGKKSLISPAIMGKFSHSDYLVRSLLVSKSFIFPFGSARFLPKKSFDEFNTEFLKLQAEYIGFREDLISNYDRYKREMRTEFVTAAKEAYERITKINGIETILNSDGSDKTIDVFVNEFLERIEKNYPNPETLRKKFSMEFSAFQMELPDLTEATIDDVAEEKEKITLLNDAYQKKMAKQMIAFAENLVKEPRERTNAVIDRIIDNLKNGKRFDVRTVDMMYTMIKDFTNLNIVGDLNIEATLNWFKETYLDKYSAKQIKASDSIKNDMLRDIQGIKTMLNDANEIQALAEAYRSKINLN